VVLVVQQPSIAAALVYDDAIIYTWAQTHSYVINSKKNE
jgi:hypothetical protein